jgi:hypothetical protein
MFFRKNVFFQAGDWRNHQSFGSKKGCWTKNLIISERAEDGLSAHTFISISKILKKIDFFEGGGGLK